MDPLARRRFARQLLLAEIGEEGQTRLCASRVKLAEDADPEAAETAREYLERAGMQVAGSDEVAFEAVVPSSAAVRTLARSDQQRHAAAALAGAFAAVEAMKAALAIGPRGSALPADLFDFENAP